MEKRLMTWLKTGRNTFSAFLMRYDEEWVCELGYDDNRDLVLARDPITMQHSNNNHYNGYQLRTHTHTHTHIRHCKQLPCETDVHRTSLMGYYRRINDAHTATCALMITIGPRFIIHVNTRVTVLYRYSSVDVYHSIVRFWIPRATIIIQSSFRMTFLKNAKVGSARKKKRRIYAIHFSEHVCDRRFLHLVHITRFNRDEQMEGQEREETGSP